MDVVGLDDVYRRKEREIKSLMMTFALVSVDWFKTLSNNLFVGVDFNYNDNGGPQDKWSIIKKDNIKTLKLHYSHDDDKVYQMINGEPIDFPMDVVQSKIENLSKSSTFKTLKFRNINIRSNNNLFYGVLNTVLPTLSEPKYDFITCSRNNLHLYEIIINKHTTIAEIEKTIIPVVKRLFSIVIDKCTNVEVISKIFQLYHKKLFVLDVFYIFSNQFSLCDIVVTGNRNYLSNIESIDITDCNLTIKELMKLIKSTVGKLVHLKVNLCYKNLIYYLSTMQEKSENLNIQRCSCDSIVKSKSSVYLEQQEFEEYWPTLKELINNHTTLEYICLNYECGFHGGIYRNHDPFPNSFVQSIVSLVSSNKSIVEFSFMSCITSQIFKEIASTNKTITHFEAAAIYGTCDFDKNLKDFNQLINENQHIKGFKFLKQTYNYQTTTFDTEMLIDLK